MGHIGYSNCFPVHALLLDQAVPPGLELRTGVPSALNAELAAGLVDVAPSSSIEYARHALRYRLFPDLAIGSAGPVGSILLETRLPPAELEGHEVALPTASATSTVLLRILLEQRFGVRPRYRWFDQDSEHDPLQAEGAAAALWIGDVALRRTPAAGYCLLDLGTAWTEWTHLPFVYALWQTSAGAERDAEIRALHTLLLESRAFFHANAP
ncbi:MAG: menaquinone biosynthesis protein, partial [Gemmatimonadetes bacterium]|nr:menaquinone biosynthesis protein [Gemmatimonadota bacterium]